MDDLQKILTQSSGFTAGSQITGGGVVAASRQGERNAMPGNPILEALTARLLEQGQGVSSSAQSELQRSIEQAMGGIQQAGDATSSRLQSERNREVAFARDRAGTTYTTALEGRSGYATQVAGLRELTETTEKSIRDLDQRYQEAILANDANTAEKLSQIRMQKLEFQAQQEQNLFNQLISVAGMQQQTIGQMMQNEQFWQGQEQQERQFTMSLAQSNWQFQKNLGVQYKQLDLAEQELDIARERNAISRAEYNLRRSELQKQKSNAFIQGILQDRLLKARNAGTVELGEVDNLTLSADLYAEIASFVPGFDMDFDEFSGLVTTSKVNVLDTPLPPSTMTDASGARVGGLFGQGGAASTVFNLGVSPMLRGISDFYLGKRQ